MKILVLLWVVGFPPVYGFLSQRPEIRHILTTARRMTHSPLEPFRPKGKLRPTDRSWLERVTRDMLESKKGSLECGKWHEVASILTAWNSFAKTDPSAPLKMELLLKRLLDEQRAGNKQVILDIEVYNALLDAWCCAALVHEQALASQRARGILVMLQERYEETQNEKLMPNAESFDLVLHAVCKTEGALLARRLLAWMEYLFKSGKNTLAKPTRTDYVIVLDTYANSGDPNAGRLAEGFLRHLEVTGISPDRLMMNIAIKAWNKSQGGRDAAEHAERLLRQIQDPDLVSYASVISAWAQSGMKAHAVARVEELVQELEDHPELKPNTVVWNSVMSAWVKSRNPAAVDRTAEILGMLETSADLQPDLTSYNTHLHALSMHAKRPGYAQAADAMLTRMEGLATEGSLLGGPNLFSYNVVIEAHCRSTQPEATLKVVDSLERLILWDATQADTYSFNQVLAALARSKMRNARQMAENLLTYQTDSYCSGAHPNACPDAAGYASVMAANARSGHPRAAERTEGWLDRMKQKYREGETQLKPTRICYNIAIDSWAKSGKGTFAARKAEFLLEEMQSIYDAGDDSMKPNIVTYNAVLNSWARSGTRCCAYKAERILDRMWERYRAGDKKVKPNDFSYNTVINAVSKSQNEGKAQKALRILRTMDKLYQAGNKEARPNEVTYTAVLNSCAFPAVPDLKTRRKALDTAIFTLEELQKSRYGSPNVVTYGTFMLACANLLPDDDTLRRDIIERAFQQCCRDGQVGEMVLTHLRRAAPDDLYEELLAGSTVRSGSSLTIHDLPEEWRRNVGETNSWRIRRRPRNKTRYRGRGKTEGLAP